MNTSSAGVSKRVATNQDIKSSRSELKKKAPLVQNGQQCSILAFKAIEPMELTMNEKPAIDMPNASKDYIPSMQIKKGKKNNGKKTREQSRQNIKRN